MRYGLLRLVIRSQSVCLSVKRLQPAKTAARIELLLGIEIQGGTTNIVVDGGPDPPRCWVVRGEEIQCGRRQITLATCLHLQFCTSASNISRLTVVQDPRYCNRPP